MSQNFMRRIPIFLGSALVLLFGAVPSFGQGGGLVGPGADAGRKEWSHPAAKQYRDAYNDMIRGTRPFNPADKEDVEAVARAARWYVYRINWTEYLTAKPEDPGVPDMVSEFETQVKLATDPKIKGNELFAQQFFKELSARLKETVAVNDKKVNVNSARMLGMLADKGFEDAGEVLADIAKTKDTNDGVRYYAYQGIGHMLARWSRTPPTTPSKKLPEYLQLLIAAVDRKPAFNVSLAQPEEIDGFRMLRREAIKALAESRVPAVADEKGVLGVKPALVLLRAMNSDGFVPETRIDEQVEAAIGITRMPAKALESYQPDYAAYQVGHLVVRAANRASQPRSEYETRAPWKVTGARLWDAMREMQNNAQGIKDEKAAAYTGQVALKCAELLVDLEKSGKAEPGSLLVWLQENTPPNNSLYKGMADSRVNPAKKPGEDKTEKPEKPPEKPEKTEKPEKPPEKPAKPDKP
jgi:hypothetical protein